MWLRLVLVAVLVLLGGERPLLVHLELAHIRGVGEKFVLRAAGTRAGGAALAAHGIGLDLDQALRVEDSTPLCLVIEDRQDRSRFLQSQLV
jgi:hypothetical protein